MREEYVNGHHLDVEEFLHKSTRAWVNTSIRVSSPTCLSCFIGTSLLKQLLVNVMGQLQGA